MSRDDKTDLMLLALIFGSVWGIAYYAWWAR